MSPTHEPDAALAPIAAYYTAKVQAHGATAPGVDWRDEAGQQRRFGELLRGLDPGTIGSIADLGCGYGALARFVHATIGPIPYTGYDIAPAMLDAARAHCRDLPSARFVQSARPLERFDVIVASGIFNVRLDADADRWQALVHDTIQGMVAHADRAVAFNCLTGFSDADRQESRLWYPDPGTLLNWCLSQFGRRVALYHDSGLYEFTVQIRVDRPCDPFLSPAGAS